MIELTEWNGKKCLEFSMRNITYYGIQNMTDILASGKVLRKESDVLRKK